MVREDLSDDGRKLLDLWSNGREEPKNIFKVYFKNEALNLKWAEMAGHLFFKNSLSSRLREIIVLRITRRCRSDYEFINHLEIARDRGLMTEEEMLDLTRDQTTLSWPPEEKALIDATNEIAETTEVSDATWTALNSAFDVRQLMDIVMTVGGYSLNSMACNSLLVDIDPEHSRDHGLTPSYEGPVDIIRHATRTATAARLERLSFQNLDEDSERSVGHALSETTEKNRVLTLAHHPLLLKDWSHISAYVEDKSGLSRADADLIMLRAFWRYRVTYAFTHAAEKASARGLSRDLIDAVMENPTAAAFDEKQSLLVRAVDQLIDQIDIEDAVWNRMRTHFSELDMMDIVFTCGNSYIKSIFLKTFRTQLEPDVPPYKGLEG